MAKIKMKREVNRKNMMAFARRLYKETNDEISYVPLCCGRLAKMNGEITGCALGELWEYFSDQPLYRFVEEKDVKYVAKYYVPCKNKEELDTLRDELEKGNAPAYDLNDGPTYDGLVILKDEDTIIDMLTQSATPHIKPLPKGAPDTGLLADDLWSEFYDMIVKVQSVNDGINIGGEKGYIKRAKAVQQHLFKAAELLK